MPHLPWSAHTHNPPPLPTDDLKETKDRLQAEIDGLNKMLSRRERNQEEVLSRARTAESALQEHQTKYKAETGASAKMIKEMEAGRNAAEEVSGGFGRCCPSTWPARGASVDRRARG